MTILLHDLIGADPARPFSPHCWKVMMALAHKGLEYERAGAGFTEIAALEGGVSRTVPILRDRGELVVDSFRIAEYLDTAYPDRPSLFGGEGGRAAARFVEGWSQSVIHTALTRIILIDVHERLGPEDQAYFRDSRENRFGATMEAFVADREGAIAAFPKLFEPMRHTLRHQPFIGGESPLFADYILFGALQWARICCPVQLLPAEDPVSEWFERCLDLEGGVGRSVSAAA